MLDTRLNSAILPLIRMELAKHLSIAAGFDWGKHGAEWERTKRLVARSCAETANDNKVAMDSRSRAHLDCGHWCGCHIVLDNDFYLDVLTKWR